MKNNDFGKYLQCETIVINGSHIHLLRWLGELGPKAHHCTKQARNP